MAGSNLHSEARDVPAGNVAGDLERFLRGMNRLSRDSLGTLGELFHEDVVFIDPFHEVRGLDQLGAYYAHMYANVSAIRFDFVEKLVDGDRACVTWNMTFTHSKINGGEPVATSGASVLRFSQGRVIRHEDYFDAGAMLYEHLPVIGWAVRKLKQRV